jgi:hypothetical protein
MLSKIVIVFVVIHYVYIDSRTLTRPSKVGLVRERYTLHEIEWILSIVKLGKSHLEK